MGKGLKCGKKGGRVRGRKWGGLRVWKREKGLAVRGGKKRENG